MATSFTIYTDEPTTKSLINVFILLLKVYTYEKGFYSTVYHAIVGGSHPCAAKRRTRRQCLAK